MGNSRMGEAVLDIIRRVISISHPVCTSLLVPIYALPREVRGIILVVVSRQLVDAALSGINY